MNSENDSDSFEIEIDSRSLESIASLTQKVNFLEIMVQHLNTRVAVLEGKEFTHGNVMAMPNQNYPVEWNLKSQKDFINYAEKKISNLKHDNEWRKNFTTISFDGVSSDNKDKILASINKTRISISRIVNTIAKEIIGIEILSTHTLGCHGMAIALSPGKASKPTINENFENRLRSVVGFIDPIFVSKDGWEYLVRRPINQMCREFKCGKRPIETTTVQSKPTQFKKYGPAMAISTPVKSFSSNEESTPSSSNTVLQNDTRLCNRPTTINQMYQGTGYSFFAKGLFKNLDKEKANLRSPDTAIPETSNTGKKYI